jgi:hypothetical protein
MIELESLLKEIHISDVISIAVGLLFSVYIFEHLILKSLRDKSTEQIRCRFRLPTCRNGNICYEWEQIAPMPPPCAEKKQKDERTGTPGAWIGYLERFFFFLVLWVDVDMAFKAIGVWLAFKVASKWETWKNVIRVPQKIDSIICDLDSLEYLRARKEWGTFLGVLIAKWLVVNGLCDI